MPKLLIYPQKWFSTKHHKFKTNLMFVTDEQMDDYVISILDSESQIYRYNHSKIPKIQFKSSKPLLSIRQRQYSNKFDFPYLYCSGTTKNIYLCYNYLLRSNFIEGILIKKSGLCQESFLGRHVKLPIEGPFGDPFPKIPAGTIVEL